MAEIVATLSVEEKYKKLIGASLGKESAYIKAKETVQDLVERSGMSERDRISIVANTIASVAAQMDAKAMDSALLWAKEERDGAYELAKTAADTVYVTAQTTKLTVDGTYVTAQTNKLDAETRNLRFTGWNIQAGTLRTYGDFTVVSNDTATIDNLSDEGTEWEKLEYTKTQAYATISKAYRDAGKITYTWSTGYGLSAVTASDEGLINANEGTSRRNTLAFDDNKHQHLLNGSSNMIGMIMNENPDALCAGDINIWRHTAARLLGYTTLTEIPSLTLPDGYCAAR